MERNKRPDWARNDSQMQRDPEVQKIIGLLRSGRLEPTASLEQIRDCLHRRDAWRDPGYYRGTMIHAAKGYCDLHGATLALITNDRQEVIGQIRDRGQDLATAEFSAELLPIIASFCRTISTTDERYWPGFTVHIQRMPDVPYGDSPADRHAVENYGTYLSSVKITSELMRSLRRAE